MMKNAISSFKKTRNMPFFSFKKKWKMPFLHLKRGEKWNFFSIPPKQSEIIWNVSQMSYIMVFYSFFFVVLLYKSHSYYIHFWHSSPSFFSFHFSSLHILCVVSSVLVLKTNKKNYDEQVSYYLHSFESPIVQNAKKHFHCHLTYLKPQ